MFLKYSGYKSMKNIKYERLVIKMPDGSTFDDQAILLKKIKHLLDFDYPDLKYQLNFFTQANPALD